MPETIGPAARAFTGRIGDGDIRPLRVFCAVTRCGGFAAAESELQIGLPSISRCIKDLETRLGVRLCRRGRVGFALTEQGQAVYASSLRLIADLERFEADIRAVHSDIAGTLTIGVMDQLITDRFFRLPEALGAYKRNNPGVLISMSSLTSNVIEQSVLEDALLCGVVVGRRRIDQLDYRTLYQEKLNLYCAEGHPLHAVPDSRISPEDVARHDYAGYSFMDGSDRSRFGDVLNKTASTDGMEAVATLVSSGCFVGMLPEHYVQSVWRLRGLRPILPGRFSTLVDIELIAKRGVASPLLSGFLDALGKLKSPARGAAA